MEQVVSVSPQAGVVAIFIVIIVALVLNRKFSLGLKTKDYFFGIDIGDKD